MGATVYSVAGGSTYFGLDVHPPVTQAISTEIVMRA